MAAPDPSSLQQIPVAQLRLGMHLHALDGPWLEHPFWKTRFVLRDPVDLQRLRDSRVATCWIDPSRGDDPADDERPAAPELPDSPLPIAAPESTGSALAEAAAAEPSRTDMAEELQHAAMLCGRAREVVGSLFHEARLGHAVDTEGCRPLVEEVTQSVLRNAGALVSLARLKTQDDYSYMHSVAVCALMVALAREMGMSEPECREAGLAGLLHDLGKAAVPMAILTKPGRLTDDEMDVIRTHPRRGHEMLQGGPGGGVGDAALEVCLHHHERPDGRGYPDGLAGAAVSRLARMGAVCDVYDAVTSNRPYKAAWDPADALARMAAWPGQFDPEVFAYLVRSLGIYPVGALVRLASGRLAVVTAQNAAQLTAPVVKAFFDTVRELPIPPRTIDLAVDRSDRITGREPAERRHFPQLDGLWAGDALPRRGR